MIGEEIDLDVKRGRESILPSLDYSSDVLLRGQIARHLGPSSLIAWGHDPIVSPASTPPSLLTEGGPIWPTLWPLATESDE